MGMESTLGYEHLEYKNARNHWIPCEGDTSLGRVVKHFRHQMLRIYGLCIEQYRCGYVNLRVGRPLRLDKDFCYGFDMRTKIRAKYRKSKERELRGTRHVISSPHCMHSRPFQRAINDHAIQPSLL